MGADGVDDLHAAEDAAGTGVFLLDELLKTLDSSSPSASNFFRDLEGAGWFSRARAHVAGWDNYCRPTCGAEGNPDYGECEEGDCCGCPCDHA